MVVDSRGGRKTLTMDTSLHSTTPGTRRRGFVAKALVRRPVDESAHWSVDERLFLGGCVCVLFFFPFFFSFSLLAVLLSSRHLLTPAKHQNISS